MQTHEKEDKRETQHKCTKCDKVYSDMRKLRKHNWRCHRSIYCTIFAEKLDSRLEIVSYRQNKHQMFRNIACIYFPECFDGDECLFDHGSSTVLCRFQSRCNRSGCQYKHNVSRRAF